MTKDEMIKIAYELQDAITAAIGKRPVRITTNRELTILRIVWGPNFEKKDWHDHKIMDAIIESFKRRTKIHIHEISIEEDSRTAVYLTKAANDPSKH